MNIASRLILIAGGMSCLHSVEANPDKLTEVSGVTTAPKIVEMRFQATVPEPCPREQSTTAAQFMIFWYDGPAIDGAFILAIRPSQIILQSMHDNPNPDFVYW